MSNVKQYNTAVYSIEEILPPGLKKKEKVKQLRVLSLEMINKNYKGYLKIFTVGSLDPWNRKAGASYYNREKVLWPCKYNINHWCKTLGDQYSSN